MLYTYMRNGDSLVAGTYLEGDSMFRFLLAYVALAWVFSGIAWADHTSPNLYNMKKPIELDAGNSPRMYVTFNHSSHQTVKCRTCHHEGLPGNRYAACTSESCHSLPGVANRKPLSIYMAYHAPDTHTSCYGCHKAEAAQHKNFKGCQPCHLTPQGKKLAAERNSGN